MFVDKRLNKNGSITFRVTYNDDSGLRKRLPSKDHPKFKTLQEAQAWVKTQDAYQQAKRAKMAKRMEWRKRFYSFETLEKAFYEWHKKRAPNSWQNDRIYIIYIFDFFLNIKQQGNVHMWNLFFQEFKDWLEGEAKGTRRGSKPISYSTANHCIRTINNFQEFLVLYNHMDPETKVTVECFPQYLVGKRTWEDVIQKDEFAHVHKVLCSIDQDVADFFYVAFWTGMRFSEIRGLPMGYLFSGELSGPIGEELKKHGLTNTGYIVLESQLAGKNIERDDKTFAVARKPLKTKRKISPENSRTIPILDKECWNILARRYKQQKLLFDATRYGTKRDNYLLFDDIKMTRLTLTLRKAYEKLNMKPKSFHCCRHSRATYLVGETRSYFLGKAILGHKSDVFDDYVHIYEMIALKAKQNDQKIEEIE